MIDRFKIRIEVSVLSKRKKLQPEDKKHFYVSDEAFKNENCSLRGTVNNQ
jgi:hypothetical protein